MKTNLFKSVKTLIVGFLLGLLISIIVAILLVGDANFFNTPVFIIGVVFGTISGHIATLIVNR